MTQPLTETDFDAWLEAVHGQSPFPWQRRLLAEVMRRGWPSTLQLPTATGKTTVLDVAVFALALQAQGTIARTVPLRIALVVDRRIVVDGAYERALRIEKSLREAGEGVVRRVAEALRRLGGKVPLCAALLRGGIYREDRWARQPNQPTILCSTVDQVGSRLLHRGYGLSPRTWPIHAGLLGNDTLIILDEAHCSRAFEETLAAIGRWRQEAERPIVMPWACVSMTATPHASEAPFVLDDEDREHPVLRRRLDARKTITLQAAPRKGDDALVATLAEAVGGLVAKGLTLLAVVNRVRTARRLYETLARKKGSDVILLTGRSRSAERDALIEKHRSRLLAGRDRNAVRDAQALVVVATQCVEVGADLDVDGLVTEACPLDALKQRLGRLDRLGEREASSCVVVCPTEQAWSGVGPVPTDAIYEEATARAWHWLSEAEKHAPLDGGAAALTDRTSGCDVSLSTPVIGAPILFPVYCELWAQTGPKPHASPTPAPFLHGPERGPADVQIVWRADLDPGHPETWADTVSLCPPVSGETLAMPFWAVRAWLAGKKEESVGDLEGLPAVEWSEPQDPPKRPFLRWSGPERSEVEEAASGVYPGDTIVLPTGYGGCDAFGWSPDSDAPVEDIADRARVAARRAPVLRVYASLLNAPNLTSVNEVVDETLDSVRELCATRSMEQDASGRIAAQLDAAWAAKGSRPRIVLHPSGRGLVVVGHAGWAEEAQDFSDEDESSSRAPGEVTLRAHLGDVCELAKTFGASLGLSAELVSDLALAGWLHDLGKADRRFQAWLRGGDWRAARIGEILAKSPKLPPNPAAMRLARERSGYPEGGRHELLSLRLAESNEALLTQAHDRDLVLHLVASHHGHCRPFAPAVDDARPLTVQFELDGQALSASSATQLERLDAGVSARFFRLLRRYGGWGLAYLEACLRLADHRASEAAEKAGSHP
ncbi:MAG: type I-U CRISPR-associated helicase/endonuclease Cas3 [Myxococcales bacterium]|nr:type I-U CRISPR-associated helicase/endonuclease Cas3 [Myxococcales bacterium]